MGCAQRGTLSRGGPLRLRYAGRLPRLPASHTGAAYRTLLLAGPLFPFGLLQPALRQVTYRGGLHHLRERRAWVRRHLFRGHPQRPPAFVRRLLHHFLHLLRAAIRPDLPRAQHDHKSCPAYGTPRTVGYGCLSHRNGSARPGGATRSGTVRLSGGRVRRRTVDGGGRAGNAGPYQ